MDLKEKMSGLQKAIQDKKIKLHSLNGAKMQLEKNLEREKAANEITRENQIEHHATYLFLLTLINECREEAVDQIETICTAALQHVYGDTYKLKFESYEGDRKDQGLNNFKMKMQIESQHDGQVLKTGLIGERGGGVVEICAFSLRMGALGWLGYDGPIILDEAYKSMSNDEKIDAVALFLREVTNATKRQMIFATHKEEIFGEIADRIIKVSKENGVASCVIEK